MITKFATLATISLASAAMAMEAQTFDTYDQSPIVRTYDAEMATKSNTLYDQFTSDPVVTIYSARQDYTKMIEIGEAAAHKSSQEQIAALMQVSEFQEAQIVALTFNKSEYSANMQAILDQQAALNCNFLSSLTTPPLGELTYKPDYSSFFSSSWGSAVEIFTQKKNRAFYLVPMAMFALGHITAHNK